jgi:hypothetical protein
MSHPVVVKEAQRLIQPLLAPIASNRSLDAGMPCPDGAESSFLPSLGYTRNTDSSALPQSISPNRAESD